jgi:hypothetical protein
MNELLQEGGSLEHQNPTEAAAGETSSLSDETS